VAKVAPRIGATLVMEPQWNRVGQITFASGLRRYFRVSSLDLNSMGSSAVAKDKDYAYFFMRRMGYPTIPGKTFFSKQHASVVDPGRGIDAAWQYARSLGLPVVVKPNSGTRGQGVDLVHTRRDFYRAMRAIFRKDDVALVQQPVEGRDYRIVVLDEDVISAYERVPLSVVGDGRSAIRALGEAKQREFDATGRDTTIKLNDPRIAAKLARTGLSLDSVPAAGERVYLLDNANLSAGGDSLDVTASVHPEFKRLAVRLTADMGLRLCGVDVIVAGDVAQAPGTYWVLEVNSAPGLDHYAKTGDAQERIVEDLYAKVLEGMDR
jgi:D-alanine-D-alanine ligase-like ATP-grasp enzyme